MARVNTIKIRLERQVKLNAVYHRLNKIRLDSNSTEREVTAAEHSMKDIAAIYK